MGIKKAGLEVTEPKKEVWELSTEELEEEIAEPVRKSWYRLVPLENSGENVETEEPLLPPRSSAFSKPPGYRDAGELVNSISEVTGNGWLDFSATRSGLNSKYV